MRSILLASAAICLSSGIAMAQTSMTSPAPTGAPNAAMSASSPQMSPGSMAPAGGTTTSPVYSGQNSIKTTTTANPAPTGAPNAAQTTPPGASPGNMAPNNTASNEPITRATGAKPMMSSTRFSHTAIPADADVKTYLHIAETAIRQHDKMTADDALSHAETRILTRAVPASAGAQPDDSPAISAIEQARHALSAGDYQTAASDTKMAMHAHHGMMSNTGMTE